MKKRITDSRFFTVYIYQDRIFKLVDQLECGDKKPHEIIKPLDVVQYEEGFLSLSNHRLATLMMCQSLHRDRSIKAWCRLCSHDMEEFEKKHKTTNHGLGIDVWVTVRRSTLELRFFNAANM